MESPLLSGVGAELNAAFDKNYCNGGGSTPSAGTGYLAVRRASTCATGVGSIATSNACGAVDDFFYLQTNGCYDENAGLSGGEVKLYGVGSADMESTLTYSRYSCDTSDRAPIYRYVSRIYYVNQSNQLVRLYLDSLSRAVTVTYRRFWWMASRIYSLTGSLTTRVTAATTEKYRICRQLMQPMSSEPRFG